MAITYEALRLKETREEKLRRVRMLDVRFYASSLRESTKCGVNCCLDSLRSLRHVSEKSPSSSYLRAIIRAKHSVDIPPQDQRNRPFRKFMTARHSLPSFRFLVLNIALLGALYYITFKPTGDMTDIISENQAWFE